jgi:hypothetical protein
MELAFLLLENAPNPSHSLVYGLFQQTESATQDGCSCPFSGRREPTIDSAPWWQTGHWGACFPNRTWHTLHSYTLTNLSLSIGVNAIPRISDLSFPIAFFRMWRELRYEHSRLRHHICQLKVNRIELGLGRMHQPLSSISSMPAARISCIHCQYEFW